VTDVVQTNGETNHQTFTPFRFLIVTDGFVAFLVVRGPVTAF
jgi:hypothetical protein